MDIVSKIDMDNGNFPIAKDALRSLAKTKISGAHRAIIDVIWMETYGWHDEGSPYKDKIKQRKTVAKIPHEVFVNETWMDKSTVSRRLNELVGWGIVIRDKNTSPYSYSFNVNVSEWSPEVFRDTKIAKPYVDKPLNSLTSCQRLTDLQDSKQFNNQSTNSLTSCQPTVDYPVNSCNAESLDNTEPNGCPKEILNKYINKSTSTKVDEQAHKKPQKPKKIVPKYSEDDKAVANYLKEKLQKRGVTALPRNWHLKEYAIAQRLLKKSTVSELRGCIDWLFSDEYWHDKIDSLLVVERQLPKYQLKTKCIRGDPPTKSAVGSVYDNLF